MNDIKISIIVPICNVEQYLDECLNSIKNQTLKDIEVICVNDGSKDNSLEIIKKYVLLDKRFKVIDKSNSGYGDSVNKGMELAQGKYIGIVESDDFIDEKMYEILWDASKDGLVDVVKANFWDYYDFPGEKPVGVINGERNNMPKDGEIFDIRKNPNILWGHPSIWSGIYKTELIKNNNIKFIEAPGGGWVDNPFFFATLCLAKKVVWTSEPLYYYRKTNPNSSSNSQSDLTLPLRRMMDNLNVMEQYGFLDEEIQKFLYARALMYLDGIKYEKNYLEQIDVVNKYANKMLSKLNEHVMKDNFNHVDLCNYYKSLSPLNTCIDTQKKILIYNWIQFDNPQKYGGGVTVYCNNLISTILRERPDVTVYFLSSGWSYDLSTTESYVRHTDNIYGDRCRSFEIVNSPVPAAQDIILNNPNIAIENKKLKKVFQDFVDKYGTFDVIHFNNLEGLSLDVFELKKNYPNTKYVFSIHNYIPMCVTGFYYQRHNGCNCSPNHTSDDCLRCTDIGRRNNLSKEILLRANRDGNSEIKEDEWIAAFSFESLDYVNNDIDYLAFTKKATKVLNENMDYNLAVSKRVAEIAIENGFEREKVKVSYIGTRIAEHQIQQSNSEIIDTIKIVHLGSNAYFKEKGFPFLLEGLAALNEQDKKKVDLVLTTTNGNDDEINKMLSEFHSVRIIHGYSHSDLRNILGGCHLGIVPVLWEDNLPQIAIEMVAMGVPILCSTFGGAKELIDNEMFWYQGGNIDNFVRKLSYLINNPNMITAFWNNNNKLVTMKEHLMDLDKVYGLTKAEEIVFSLEDYATIMAERDFLYRNIYGVEHYREVICYSDKNTLMNRVTRKIKGLRLCYLQHGFKYTVRRVLFHLGLK